MKVQRAHRSEAVKLIPENSRRLQREASSLTKAAMQRGSLRGSQRIDGRCERRRLVPHSRCSCCCESPSRNICDWISLNHVESPPQEEAQAVEVGSWRA